MRNEKILDKIPETIDTPLIVMTGAIFGALVAAVVSGTIGALAEAPEGSVWDWKSLVWSGACFGIALAITAIAHIYWKLVPKRNGVMLPALNGFALLPALCAFMSTLSILLIIQACFI